MTKVEVFEIREKSVIPFLSKSQLIFFGLILVIPEIFDKRNLRANARKYRAK